MLTVSSLFINCIINYNTIYKETTVFRALLCGNTANEIRIGCLPAVCFGLCLYHVCCRSIRSAHEVSLYRSHVFPVLCTDSVNVKTCLRVLLVLFSLIKATRVSAASMVDTMEFRNNAHLVGYLESSAMFS